MTNIVSEHIDSARVRADTFGYLQRSFLADISDVDAEEAEIGGDTFIIPTPGVAIPADWCNASAHAADHFAAGSVDSAVQLLSRQIGAVNIHDLKSAAIASFLGSTAFFLCHVSVITSNYMAFFER